MTVSRDLESFDSSKALPEAETESNDSDDEDDEDEPEFWGVDEEFFTTGEDEDEATSLKSERTVLDVQVELIGAKRRVRRAKEYLDNLAMSDEAREVVLTDLTEVEDEIDELRKLLVGADIDDAINNIMKGS